MMYYTILASFCLLGMASSQTINSLNNCLSKEQHLIMICTFTKDKQSATSPTCTYRVNDKVAATTNSSIPVDSTYKGRAKATITENECTFNLTGFSDGQAKNYTCTIQQDKTATSGISLTKQNTPPCSAGDTLKHSGVILLLPFVLPLLSGML